MFKCSSKMEDIGRWNIWSELKETFSPIGRPFQLYTVSKIHVYLQISNKKKVTHNILVYVQVKHYVTVYFVLYIKHGFKNRKKESYIACKKAKIPNFENSHFSFSVLLFKIV